MAGKNKKRQVRRFGGGPSPLADPKKEKAALKMLAAGDTYDAIALEIGYANGSGFSSAWYNRFGDRPSAYRS